MRRALQPLDITLRHGRLYQWVRRLFLGFSVSLTFFLPLWHLHAGDVVGSGLAGDRPWAGLASLLPDRAPPLIGAPTSISFFGVELLDPAMALGVALVRGVDMNWLWAVGPGLILVAVLGRFFCGWACPYLPILAASNAARWFLSRLGVPMADLKVPRLTSRVVLVGVLIATAFTGLQVMPLVYPPALIGRAAFHAIFFGSLGLGALLVMAAFLFDTLVSRAGFCRSLCPGGAMWSGSTSIPRRARSCCGTSMRRDSRAGFPSIRTARRAMSRGCATRRGGSSG